MGDGAAVRVGARGLPSDARGGGPLKASHFLLFESRFPYSVRHNVETAHASVVAAFGLEPGAPPAAPAGHLRDLLAELLEADRAPLDSAAVARAVETTQRALNAAGAALAESLFAPSERSSPDEPEAPSEPSRPSQASQAQNTAPQ